MRWRLVHGRCCRHHLPSAVGTVRRPRSRFLPILWSESSEQEMAQAQPKKSSSRHVDDAQTPLEEEAKAIGPQTGRAALFCTDDCLHRYLRARNWNVKKSEKMLRETLKWRATYKPEEIKWDEVAAEAETGKVYRASFSDRVGRSVIVMRPANQNTADQPGQIRHLVHSLENAILSLPADQEQMVWLIDFKGWTIRKSVPISTVREVAYVLQNMYPERLCIAILYDPPKIFETLWALVKPFLDVKTFHKVKFVFKKNPDSLKIVEEYFDLDILEAPFGGRNTKVYNHEDYANQMKLDDVKTAEFWKLNEPDVSANMRDAQDKEPKSKDVPGKKASKASKAEATKQLK